MNDLKKYNFRLKYIFTVISFLISIGVSSCSMDSEIDDIPINSEESLNVGAYLSPTLYSRTYIEEGDVTEGTYYLSYRLPNSDDYGMYPVNFGVDGSDERIGFVDNGDPNKKFNWDMVGGDNTPYFYLDNVKPTDNSTPSTVIFTDNYNPFIAGELDRKDGTNDLLWGEKQVTRKTTGTLNFNLHHNMAGIRIQVTVDKENEKVEGDLDLTGAEVRITSVIQKPISFNRLDGTLTLPDFEDATSFSDLMFVGPETDWKSSDEDKLNPNIMVYTTQDFVLPPQNLKEDADRPKLTIKLKSGKSYSGILPHAMLITDPTFTGDDEFPYPVALTFLKEHILIIRTKVTEEPPELAFMPVVVVDWVDKGEFTSEGHQAGLYTAEEFYRMINYYKEKNQYQLNRYGTYNEAEKTWSFDIFNSFTLDYDKINGEMKVEGDNKYSFTSHNYTIYVTNGTTTQAVTMQQLYNILNGTPTSPFE